MKKIIGLIISTALLMTSVAACGGAGTTLASTITATSTVAASTTAEVTTSTSAVTTTTSLATTTLSETTGSSELSMDEIDALASQIESDIAAIAESGNESGITIGTFETLAEKDMSPYQKWYKSYAEFLDEASEEFTAADKENNMLVSMFTFELIGGDIALAMASTPMAKQFNKAEVAESFNELGMELITLEYDGVTGTTEVKDSEGVLSTTQISFDEASGTVDFVVKADGVETFRQSIAFKDNKLAKSMFTVDGSRSVEFFYDGNNKSSKFSAGNDEAMPASVYKNMAAAEQADYATKYASKIVLENGNLTVVEPAE